MTNGLATSLVSLGGSYLGYYLSGSRLPGNLNTTSNVIALGLANTAPSLTVSSSGVQVGANLLIGSLGSNSSTQCTPPSTSGQLALTSQIPINSYWYQAYTVNASNVLSSNYTTYSSDNGASVSMSSATMQFQVPGVYLMRCTGSVASVAAGSAWTLSIPSTSGLTAYPASFSEYNDSTTTAHAVASSWESIVVITAACSASFTSNITNQVYNISMQLKRVS